MIEPHCLIRRSKLSHAGFRAFPPLKENGFVEGMTCFVARFR
jgi:hypothetical protein